MNYNTEDVIMQMQQTAYEKKNTCKGYSSPIMFVSIKDVLTRELVDELRFNRTNIDNVLIQGTKEIDSASFANKDSHSLQRVKNLVLMDPLFKINDYAFAGVDLHGQSVTMPESMKEIGKGAFEDCNIDRLYVKDNIEYIGSEAFKGNRFKSVTIPYDCEYEEDSFNEGISIKKIRPTRRRNIIRF